MKIDPKVTHNKNHYYIDRKLVNSNYLEVVEGLNELIVFLQQPNNIDTLNSIIMRLIDLFINFGVSYVKVKIADLMVRFEPVFEQLPSKREVIAHLYKSLKSADEVLRVLTMGIICKMGHIFHKENQIYHLLLSKWRKEQKISMKQKFSAGKALSALLRQSTHLATLYSGSLLELHSLGRIELKCIVYLCVQANFVTHLYPEILRGLWSLLCDSAVSSSKTVRYFKKLVIKAAAHNYECLQWADSNIVDRYPELCPALQHIKQINYSFLFPQVDLHSLSNSVLLDLCYQSRKLNSGNFAHELSQACSSRIQQALALSSAGQLIQEQVLLLSFYCPESYDESICVNIVSSYSKIDSECRRRTLKMALVTGNFKTSSFLIEQEFNFFHQDYTMLVLLKAYVNLRTSKEGPDLQLFMEILSESINELQQAPIKLYFTDLYANWRKTYALESNCPPQSMQGAGTLGECCRSLFLPESMQNQQYSRVYFGKKPIVYLVNRL